MSLIVNLSEFKRELEREKKDVEKSLRDTVRGFLFKALTNIINLTPVDTGNLRANWSVSENFAGNRLIDYNGNGDIAGNIAISEATPVIRKQKTPDFWYIYNNVDYAESIENGGSKKAPKGMLALGTQQALLDLNNFLKG